MPSQLTVPEENATRAQLTGLDAEPELWRRHLEEGDPAAKDEIVRRYLPYAQKLASRYRQGAEPFDDLLQVAYMGLINAVQRYDPARGIPFTGFASPTILGELRRHFRDRCWTVRIPRGAHDLLIQVEKATEELSIELQRAPSVNEIAERLEIEPTEVLEAFSADRNRRAVSLDRPAGEDQENGSLLEWIGDEDGGYELAEGRFSIESALQALDGREREALKLRFEDEMTQSEIAAVIGCSQMHVSRILRRALGKIREEASAVRGEET